VGGFYVVLLFDDAPTIHVLLDAAPFPLKMLRTMSTQRGNILGQDTTLAIARTGAGGRERRLKGECQGFDGMSRREYTESYMEAPSL